MNRQSVTLRAHDSINLTTGVVTRSDTGIPSQVASATSPANSQSRSANGAWGTIFPAHADGIRMNDLESLWSAINGLDLFDLCCNQCGEAMQPFAGEHGHWSY